MFSESHLDVPDPILRAHLCPTPRLASTFRGEFIPGVPRCLCPATPCGMNDSVRTQCFGVTFGGVEKAPLLGCFLTPECFDVEVLTTSVSTPRHHAACCCPILRLTTLLHCLSERWCHVSCPVQWLQLPQLRTELITVARGCTMACMVLHSWKQSTLGPPVALRGSRM